MKTRIAMIALGLCAAATASFAQQVAGDREIQVQGSLSLKTSGEGSNSGNVTVTRGQFLTDLQEVGVSINPGLSGSKDYNATLGAFYRYNFSTSQIVPYVGASVGFTYIHAAGRNFTSGTLTPEVGVRYFVDRRTAFNVSAANNYSTKEKEFDKHITIQFGFSHFWSK